MDLTGRPAGAPAPAGRTAQDPGRIAYRPAVLGPQTIARALSDRCAMLGPVKIESVSPVFVGRAEELDALCGALARVGAALDGPGPATSESAGPRTLLLGGEAGIGKTRLVEEFTAAANREGAVVAVGGCVEIGAEGLPFAPFSAALRSLRAQLPEVFDEAVEDRTGELARLLPELGEAEESGHHPDALARLFELTVTLLERIAARRPVVLVLEDLHWADASTRHLLAHLYRNLRAGRLLVLATYRSDDLHRRHPLRPLLAELDRLRTVQRLELHRLDHEQVGRQMAGILGTAPERAVLDEVFRRSEGNPFFVEELTVASCEGCRVGLSESLRDLLLVRVEALPEDAQTVARLVAEGGSTVEHPLLAAVSAMSEDTLIAALRAAVGANLLSPTPDGEGYRFRHSLVREAVSDDLLPGERSRINRRYAEAVESEPALVSADVRPARLASYWYYAQAPDKALPAVLDASVEARRRHAYAEQLRLLERAMELWDAAPNPRLDALSPMAEAYPPCGCDPATTALELLDVLAEATEAGRLCGERERALALTKRALRLVDEAADPLRAAWFWVQRSRLVTNLARGDGWEELRTASELVKGLPPSEVHAEVLAHVAGWQMLHSPGPDSLTSAQRAVDYARMVGAQDTELSARTTLGCLLVDSGSVEAGLAELRAVKERSTTLGLAPHIGRVHVNLPSSLEAIGRSAEAVEVLREGTRLAHRYGLAGTAPYVWNNLAESLLSLGRLPEAEQALAEADRTSAGTASRGFTACLRAELALRRGDHPRVRREIAVADDHAPGGGRDTPQRELPLRTLAVTLAAREGRVLEGRALILAALEAGFATGVHRYAWPLLLAGVELEADARGLPAAEPGREAVLDRLERAARRLATPVALWQAHAQWVRTELRRARGADDAADWAETHAALLPLDRPHDLVRVRLRLAEAQLAEGNREAALALLRQAHGAATAMGATAAAEAAAQTARRARLSLTETAPAAQPPSGPVDPAAELGLTSRERDVLRLVAAGRSNRQIAETLFISPKTASVHVSHILAKLGVTGRGEAGALAHRLRLFPAEQQRTAGAAS